MWEWSKLSRHERKSRKDRTVWDAMIMDFVQRQVVWKILGPSDWLASMPDEVRCAYRLIGDENVSVMR
jgi:hypothetical protein